MVDPLSVTGLPLPAGCHREHRSPARHLEGLPTACSTEASALPGRSHFKCVELRHAAEDGEAEAIEV